MKQFTVITKENEVTLSYPTSMKDIPADYLIEITKNIQVADYHSLVALVYRAPIYNIVLTFKQKKKGVDARVVPIFVKSGNADTNSIINEAKVKDVLVIPSQSLEFAYHVNPAGNTMSIEYLTNLLEDDVRAAERALLNNFVAYFISFKIIPNSDIKGFYKSGAEIPKLKYVDIKPLVEEVKGGDASQLSSTGGL